MAVSNQSTSLYELTPDGFRVALFDSIKKVDQDWASTQPTDNQFLKQTYLNLLEEHPPKGMRFHYLLFYKNDQPIGVAVAQLLSFNVAESIPEVEQYGQTEAVPLSTKVKEQVKKYFAKKLNFNLLVGGNLLLTGQYGFHFKEGELTDEGQVKIYREALNVLRTQIEKEGTIIDVFFIKDLESDEEGCAKVLAENQYHKFTFNPNMYLDIRAHWNTFEDYTADMSSKYRTRAKRAFKKGKNLVRKEFNWERIKANNERLYSMYQSISAGVSFNILTLHPDYFLALKETYQEDFKLIGYYVEDELIGFHTTLLNGPELEAHFLGFDGQYNSSHQLYLNILYDIVREGIEQKRHKVVFARTAMEIKSSVGAEPQALYSFLKYKGNFRNRFTGRIIKSFEPNDNWVQRKPFKE